MVYIALDTCVWIKLLGIKLTSDHSELDGLLYLIDRKEITNITTENLIREWNRQKVKRFDEIIDTYKNVVGSTGISQIALPLEEDDYLRNLLTNRIQRIDAVLASQSEVAKENENIISEAWKRSYKELAPNHDKDSFRDTVNVLSLLHYLKTRQIKGCLFVTNNHKDFSSKNSKLKCHPHLEYEFAEVQLEYVFFESRSSNFLLFEKHLRKQFSDYRAYLIEKRKKELDAKQEANRATPVTIDIPTDEYLDNLQYIDTILSKKKLSIVDRQIIDWLIKSHDSYKQYFLRKVGANGLV